MTRVTIELNNAAKLNFLLAFLQRLGPAGEIKVAVEQQGQGVAFAPPAQAPAGFEAMVNQVVEDALAGRLGTLTLAEKEAEWRWLSGYGAQKAAELGITSDEEVDRLVKQQRASQRVANGAEGRA